MQSIETTLAEWLCCILPRDSNCETYWNVISCGQIISEIEQRFFISVLMYCMTYR